ncbi:MAG: Serine/threonine-protein kinase PknD [Phycisphaerae bacterium]|nr:Serine/threonine-protein kinase PknD [Phycisphaerae bacterium]
MITPDGLEANRLGPLDPDEWRRIDAVFSEALDLESPERAAFLDRSFVNAPRLRAEVERMLRADEDSSGFMSAPPAPDMFDVLLEPPPLPRRIGRYPIVRVIASGGMGVVYEGLQTAPRRRVAVKILRTPFVGEQAARRFLREAEILARLRHPGIVQVIEADVFDHAGAATPYLVMEYVSGAEDILTHARRCGLDLRQRLRLFGKVCQAVQHAHEHGVVHRDIKPANLLIDDRGEPRVIDFGVAAVREAGRAAAPATVGGQILGTLTYMSPEQACGRPETVTRAADVYSLGVVLYELLTGRLPYDLSALPMPQVLKTIVETPPRAPEGLPPAVRRVLMNALEKSPDRRPSDPAALAAALNAAVAPPAEAPVPREGRPATRRWPAPGKVAVGIGLLAAVAGLLRFASPDDGRRRASDTKNSGDHAVSERTAVEQAAEYAATKQTAAGSEVSQDAAKRSAAAAQAADASSATRDSDVPEHAESAAFPAASGEAGAAEATPASVECDRIEDLRGHCVPFDDGTFKIVVRLRSRLAAETPVTFALNERGFRPKTIKERGKGLATWKVDDAGPHQVNLRECPDAAAVIDCAATTTP